MVRDVIMATDMGRHAAFCAAVAAAAGGAAEGGGGAAAASTAATPLPAVGGDALLHMQLLLKCAHPFFLFPYLGSLTHILALLSFQNKADFLGDGT